MCQARFKTELIPRQSGTRLNDVEYEMSQYYRYYVLFILTLASVLNIADRLIMSILMEDIKGEFTLTDTQMGLLAGLAFALFYALMSLPIARFADKSNRKNILAAALVIWSGMTASVWCRNRLR